MITIVSGLPRCGTSMMMQILEAGGLPVMTDGLREADSDNPMGYYELEKVKQIKEDSSWIPEAEGKVFKMISQLLYDLPADREYKIVFMLRKMEELLASQSVMLKNLGKNPGDSDDDVMKQYFERHVEKLKDWLKEQQNIQVLNCFYNDIMGDPETHVQRINEFFDGSLNAEAMLGVIKPDLHRQRQK
ncbi:hypothetical protein BVX94_03815 [bacterium B17]|nr:hypothetical protein BVX94_03815 [bacterium B17]